MFLGTDHGPDYHGGINTINAMIGINPFFGNFSLSFIPVDTTNPLMVEPNDLGPQLYDNSTPGQTPYGLQPNGRILYTVAWHSGNPDTPGISSTIEGGIGFHVEIVSPTDGSIIYDEMISFSGEETGGDPPYTFTWESDIDGYLGTGATILVDSNSMSVGLHIITLTGVDDVSRIDDDQISINISAPTATPTETPTPTPSPSPTPTPPCFNHGDVNFSGVLTADDAQTIFTYILGYTIPTFTEACAADCNGDEDITSNDAQTVFYSVLGIGDGCVDDI